MRRTTRLVTTEDRRQIARAVAEAEARTAAEIVPVVAACSGRYDRAEDVVGLWTGVLALAVVWFFVPPPTGGEAGSWSAIPAGLHLLAGVVAVVVGFVVGTLLGSRIAWLRRLFISATQMRDEVGARAQQTFFLRRVHRTAGATGLLIYVSLFERVAAIVADQTVLEKLGQAALDEFCAALTTDVRSTGPIPALDLAIRRAGERLAPVLPRATGEVNEYADALVVID